MGVATKGKVERRVTTNTFKYCMEISQLYVKEIFIISQNIKITILLLYYYKTIDSQTYNKETYSLVPNRRPSSR